MKCQARQHSDQMICHKCGLVWDMNDPEPPVCVTTVRHIFPEVTPCDFVFRSKLCGYTGDEPNCNKSFSGCHNKQRFNGLPWSTK